MFFVEQSGLTKSLRGSCSLRSRDAAAAAAEGSGWRRGEEGGGRRMATGVLNISAHTWPLTYFGPKFYPDFCICSRIFCTKMSASAIFILDLKGKVSLKRLVSEEIDVCCWWSTCCRERVLVFDKIFCQSRTPYLSFRTMKTIYTVSAMCWASISW